MIDVMGWLFPKIANDATVVSIAGGNIWTVEPEIKTVFPAVYVRETNEPDAEFLDDAPTASDSTVVVDVYVENASPFALAKAVCDVFAGLTWACTMNTDITD